MSEDLEEIHNALHKGAAHKIGEFHWYIIKSYIEYKRRVASDVNGWRTFHSEKDVISLQARAKQAFDAAQTLKTASTKIARKFFNSYEEMISTLESFATTHEQEINELHEFIVWLYRKDPIAPSTFLFKRPIWSTTRHRNMIIEIKEELPTNDATNVMRASDIVFGLWNQGDKFLRHTIPIETAYDEYIMLDPEEQDKLATEDPLQVCVKLGYDPQSVISNVCSHILNEFAAYFERLRNSFDVLLNQIENYMAQHQFSLFEDDEEKFSTKLLIPLLIDLEFEMFCLNMEKKSMGKTYHFQNSTGLI